MHAESKRYTKFIGVGGWVGDRCTFVQCQNESELRRNTKNRKQQKYRQQIQILIRIFIEIKGINMNNIYCKLLNL